MTTLKTKSPERVKPPRAKSKSETSSGVSRLKTNSINPKVKPFLIKRKILFLTSPTSPVVPVTSKKAS